jgi:acetyl esterase/lipase
MIHVLHDTMPRFSWLCGLLGASLGALCGCGGTENNKPTASSTAAPSLPAPIRIQYGSVAQQFGDLRVPTGTGPHPVVVVLHGGCWLDFYGLDLMDGLSAALTAEGIATWNIEYRRIGDGGAEYPNPLLDVGAGVDHLRSLASAHKLDLSKVTTVGHSAGGHLAVWVAARGKLAANNPLRGADPLPVRAVVSLAGILDLAESIDVGVCNGAAAKLLAGSASEVPAHYAEASPRALLPIGVRQSLIHGSADVMVPLVMSQHYLDAAKAAGESNVTLDVIEGADHFEVINPSSSSKWSRVLKGIVDVAR